LYLNRRGQRFEIPSGAPIREVLGNIVDLKVKITRRDLNVSVGPIADIRSALFNYFIGKPLELLRHIEAQRLSGRQINDKFAFCGRLHRQVDRPFTIENAIGISRGQSKLVPHLTSVGQ